MGRYIDTYRNNQTTDLESAVGTIATIGLLNLIPEPTLAWKCEITDTLYNLRTEGDWEPTKDMAHDSAWHAIQELISEREEEQRQEQEARKKQTRPDEDSDLTTVLIKWGIYIALFFGAVWLAFAIVLPLLLLDAALVLLICGLVWKENAKIFFALAIAGIIYPLLDVHFAGLSASLVARAVFFQTVITAACISTSPLTWSQPICYLEKPRMLATTNFRNET